MKVVALDPELERVIDSVKDNIKKGILNENMRLPQLEGEQKIFLAKAFDKFRASLIDEVKYSEKVKLIVISKRTLLSEKDILKEILASGATTLNSIIFFGQTEVSVEDQKNGRLILFNQKRISMEDDVCDSIMGGMKEADNSFIILDMDSVSDIGFRARDLIYYLQRISHLKNIRKIYIKDFSGPRTRCAPPVLMVNIPPLTP